MWCLMHSGNIIRTVFAANPQCEKRWFYKAASPWSNKTEMLYKSMKNKFATRYWRRRFFSSINWAILKLRLCSFCLPDFGLLHPVESVNPAVILSCTEWVCGTWIQQRMWVWKALNGQSFSFDGNDLFWWRMQPERKCLGGPGRFEIETPHLRSSSLSLSVALSLPPSSVLPSHHFDWIPGCDSGLSSHVIHLCLAPKGYLT